MRWIFSLVAVCITIALFCPSILSSREARLGFSLESCSARIAGT